ncbi:hypothetical protein BCR32DRAFT_249938 [Anaeromyces robustus]|uniref:Uncharacterized protein n=1 Tax=Anaeromyces robustus TaxID=1754192 RepID=A0A1Y1WK26_9FUNG|nr:hypothetical protein BCR32DRAFT_249938 [Anaeromyces robustus]|eukprot:ORX73454.1 hypothetical protein BCR32DRAFT_249938 [Anaeromyces robustus]
MILVDSEELDITNNYHPIVYFLIILLNHNKNKDSKCFGMLKKYLENYDIKLSDIENIDDPLEYKEINSTDIESSETEDFEYGNIEIDDLNDVINNLNIKDEITNSKVLKTDYPKNEDRKNEDPKNEDPKNEDQDQKIKYKYDIIDIIYQCMDDYGLSIVDKARLITIKKYYNNKASLTYQTVYNIFIILYLGYLVFSDNEWYKFSYGRHGWEIISSYDLAKEINIGLISKLTKLCNHCNYSLEKLPKKLFNYMRHHAVTYKNLDHLETFFFLGNFISRMDKSQVLRFEDCVYDFNIKKPRPGLPRDFCLKSTNYNYFTKNKEKMEEIK